MQDRESAFGRAYIATLDTLLGVSLAGQSVGARVADAEQVIHCPSSGTLADMLELADEALMYALSVQADQQW